ncbi:LEAF RUST 10 DISEASE-RESISTANCE LOCUS RECEPTOR-LIKE PROTEIN KINASE-like 1.2 isoform X2 [Mercurialis annua]|uniref:LEAF RUST 10 DISEASE-RESISTANCE LOCUS RECEPTOR-LIKE PROTEIN KINASE-like 1.2 isoform X2 n=1 Tax=Mercurialis annua TaxID=3986 RepID=UPI00215F057F|nr:LEAF RUST 10 DISEASE-RESISTANCE LOCUS RECEPTOR-LIKE PROTEIN KINASE-like 1.2 isoform X2 [Mercurialis annua]
MTLSLLFITFLLTNGASLKSPNPNYCPPFNCGNGVIISYPFWHQAQQHEYYCGYPGFNISCHAQTPVLHLSNNGDFYYPIKNINSSNKSVTVSYTELNCPKLTHDFVLRNSLFNYTIGNKIVKFFYNCSLYPPSLPHVQCLQYGGKRSYEFKEGEIPEFDWRRYCESTVVAPVLDEGVNGGLFGFKLTWKQPADGKCRSCEASGGFCGYDNGLTDDFFCICDGGRRSISCHDSGNFVTTAQEPNYAAIGGLISGALIIIAGTVFYLIQRKKKLGSYKPV